MILKHLVEVARAPLTPQLPGGEDAPDGSLHAGAIFFLLDGGLRRNMRNLYSSFQNKTKVSEMFTVLKDVASMDAGHERVRGVGNIRQRETMLSITQNQLTLPLVKYQTYHGGTYGDVIGPVVLTPQEP